MNGTRVTIKNKETGGKKILYFLGVPQQFHLYLRVKDDLEFCPEPIDNDLDFIQSEYDNVTVTMTPIEIDSTGSKKHHFVKEYLNKQPDVIEPQDNIFSQYIWRNVPRYKAEELIAAVGGLIKGETYILIDTGL